MCVGGAVGNLPPYETHLMYRPLVILYLKFKFLSVDFENKNSVNVNNLSKLSKLLLEFF